MHACFKNKPNSASDSMKNKSLLSLPSPLPNSLACFLEVLSRVSRFHFIFWFFICNSKSYTCEPIVLNYERSAVSIEEICSHTSSCLAHLSPPLCHQVLSILLSKCTSWSVLSSPSALAALSLHSVHSLTVLIKVLTYKLDDLWLLSLPRLPTKIQFKILIKICEGLLTRFLPTSPYS